MSGENEAQREGYLPGYPPTSVWFEGEDTIASGDRQTPLGEAQKRIAELERENARLHALYFAERAAHNDRGGA
jgi:hypothetical protein